ncbi:Uncharacterized protein conserved in bacteria [Legionella lansingensis]|uniref:YheO-like PAS domain protein n=1 Tax=Legionella lansingensis TaxID=45067 RepID=A0A0W0VKM7_9GAMM|nr:PAS domain-containing protein [Legionella lansingensis]KTD20377.1 YheO-like PAS domain protein [Legionella lansingensis]SNV51551.1 Uncharacterized protein conserved in bacteria [Legionella lansingensis]
MKKSIHNILSTAEAIQKLFHPYAEVVVHDLQQDQIVAIFNPFSKRRVGEPSLFSKEEKMAAEVDCIGPYEKLNWDGRKLKSVSSVIRDEDNKAVGMLCINLDVSSFEKFNRALLEFLHSPQMIAQPALLFKDDWQERINRFIHDYLNKNHLSLDVLTRQEKRKLIEHLHVNGAFTGKNSANYIAQILKISRATVYNYLGHAPKIIAGLQK